MQQSDYFSVTSGGTCSVRFKLLISSNSNRHYEYTVCSLHTQTDDYLIKNIYLNPKLVTNQYCTQNRRKSVWEVSLIATLLIKF